MADSKDMCAPHYRKWRRQEGLDKEQTRDYRIKHNRTLDGKWSMLKRAAKVKGLGFDITKDVYSTLLTNPCTYCGGRLAEAGYCLDRKDSNKGYLVDNVVPCCRDCNRVKLDVLTHEEMLAAMKAVLAVRSAA